MKKYTEVEMEIVQFDEADVITGSSCVVVGTHCPTNCPDDFD